MAELPTLSSIRFALERELEKELTSAALFTSLNTRLIIRTGVNLKKIQPEQNADPALVRRGRGALQQMGFDLSGGAR